MRKIILLILLVSACYFAQCQFLKKFKDKVNSAVDKTVGGNSQSSGSNNTKTTTGTGEANAPYDFTKNKIAATVLFHPGEIKEKTKNIYFPGTVYSVSGHTILCRTAVFASDRNMGEATEFQNDDAAYIFENGAQISKSTVGRIKNDSALKIKYSQRDWPFSYSGNDLPVTMYPEITFNGKSYGEYMAVTSVLVSKDKSRFYAIAGASGKDDVVYYLISSDGRKIKLPTLGAGVLVNADFTNAGVYGFVNKLEKEENKTGNVMKAAANTLNESDVYFIDGTVLKNAVNVANGWLDLSGKNILNADRQSGNYLNGKKISETGSDPGNVWCNAGAGSWAYLSAGSSIPHLIFSDGTDVPNPYHPQQLAMDGKTYMVWLQYRNGLYDSDLLLCTKEL